MATDWYRGSDSVDNMLTFTCLNPMSFHSARITLGLCYTCADDCILDTPTLGVAHDYSQPNITRGFLRRVEGKRDSDLVPAAR